MKKQSAYEMSLLLKMFHSACVCVCVVRHALSGMHHVRGGGGVAVNRKALTSPWRTKVEVFAFH